MNAVTRFAPSPTGRLHVGNIRTALHNLLFSLKNGGTFILRIDDTDRARSTREFEQAIRDDLDWLGLTADRTVRQSERFDLYEREFERLKSAKRVYPCYETAEELELRRKVLLGRGPPRSMSASQMARRFQKAGRLTGASGSIRRGRSSGTISSVESSASIPSCSAT